MNSFYKLWLMELISIPTQAQGIIIAHLFTLRVREDKLKLSNSYFISLRSETLGLLWMQKTLPEKLLFTKQWNLPIFEGDHIETMEFLVAKGANVMAENDDGQVAYNVGWRHSSKRFLQILGVNEELPTLERLNLFTDNLEILLEATLNNLTNRPKQERPYTLTSAKDGKIKTEMKECKEQRVILFFLKTFCVQNIDLRIVEEQFINAENE